MNKTALLHDTHQKFLQMGLGIVPMTDLEEIVSPDYMGFGTTEDEKMFSLTDLRNLIQRQNEQSAGMDLQWNIQNIYSRISPHEMSAFRADDIIGSLKIGDEETQIQLRFSCVYEFLDNKWIAVHSHGSKPEFVETAVDTFGIEEWKQKTAALEKIVAERTAEIVRQKEELEQALKELKATQAQLIQKEKLASLGELTAGIAHEIQNPLNFVNNFSEVSTELVDELEEEADAGRVEEVKAIAGDLRQNLQKITHHGGRASSIVKGMLEHSRASTGEKRPTNLNALADEYFRLSYQGLRAKYQRFTAELKTDFANDLPMVNGVAQDIGRVLLNLYNNAFYAVHEKQKTAPADYQPTVSVITKQANQTVEIRVRDNGTGIPDTIREKIFQPFFTTKPTGEGTGLGLSLSYDIITKGHGGTMTVESVEGEGSEFVIILPC